MLTKGVNLINLFIFNVRKFSLNISIINYIIFMLGLSFLIQDNSHFHLLGFRNILTIIITTGSSINTMQQNIIKKSSARIHFHKANHEFHYYNEFIHFEAVRVRKTQLKKKKKQMTVWQPKENKLYLLYSQQRINSCLLHH